MVTRFTVVLISAKPWRSVMLVISGLACSLGIIIFYRMTDFKLLNDQMCSSQFVEETELLDF